MSVRAVLIGSASVDSILDRRGWLSLHRAPMIYIIYARNLPHAERLYTIYYVGKTKQSLYKRLWQHVNTRSPIGLLMFDNEFLVDAYQASNAADLADLERDAIWQLAPMLNKQGNPLPPLQVKRVETGLSFHFPEERL